MTTYVPLEQLSEEEYKKRVRSWTLYDWANSAFATTILSAILPIYYSQVAGGTLPSAAIATRNWSYTLSISVLIVAILSPILGTMSDIMRGKKKFLSIFITIGAIATGCFVFVGRGDWLLASIIFIGARVAYASANVFYDALLPHIAKEEDQDRVSTQGYALGYLGGGLLLAINIAMILFMEDDFLGPNIPSLAERLSLLSVAIWWAVFSIPLFRNIPEPRSASHALKPGESLIEVSFRRIAKTLREIRTYKDLFRFLIAFLIYSDAIGVIIGTAAIYGTELGFGATELIIAVLLVQFVGIPYSLIFGHIATKGHKWQTKLIAFVVFNIVALPIAGVTGFFTLPTTVTGSPSPPFVNTETALGQGQYPVVSQPDAPPPPNAPPPPLVFAEDLTFTGDSWKLENISGELRGEDQAIPYAQTDQTGAVLEFTYNGQKIEFIHSVGPNHGMWLVEIDGQPASTHLCEGGEEEGNEIEEYREEAILDAYRDQVRYDERATYRACDEGKHLFTLTNLNKRNEDSSGNLMSISRVEVSPPVRNSNLLTIFAILIGVQLAGIVFAFVLGDILFKRVAETLDTKRSIMLSLVAYSVVAIWGFFLDSMIEFWFLAWIIAIVQGGSQALSRSLYASLSPTSMSGEFFGLFSIMVKFASFLSPLVLVASVNLWGTSRYGILSLVLFFVVGMVLLTTVDVEAGIKLAKERDKELLANAT